MPGIRVVSNHIFKVKVSGLDIGTFRACHGLSMEFADWRFNLRGSNTEPLVRLNVESRADAALMRDKTDELLALLDR